MRIQTRALALAVGLGSAIAWTICSLLVALVPAPAMSLTGSMVHMMPGSLGWHLTLGGFLAGLIAWSLFGGLFAGLCAGLYNRLCGAQIRA